MSKKILCVAGAFFLNFLLSTEAQAESTVPETGQNSAVSQKALVRPLKNPDMVEGCGCYFKLPSEWKKKTSRRFIFLSKLEGTPAYMNIGGKDVKLTWVGSRKQLEKEKKGSRFSRNYQAGDIHVQVDFVTKRVPLLGEEVSDYTATFTVNKQDQTQSFRATGNCGC